MKSDGPVQSVDRALLILEALAQHEGGLRLTDLAREMELAPSTTHRLLTALEYRGFAQLDPQHGRWHIGRGAFAVGITFARWQNYIAAAMPYLARLRDLTRETANLGVYDEGEMLTVAQVQSREIIRAITTPGGRAPVLNSGMGKAILASWPDDAITALVERRGLRLLTRQSLRSLEQVMIEIGHIRARGYAYDDEEFTLGMRCVAAVVWSASGEPMGGISISALAARLPKSEMAGVGETVRDVALQLTHSSGGTPPLNFLKKP